MPIHVAITRRVLPGREAEFQQALREFFQTSFAHASVLGASMLVPAPGSDDREYGILRTFASTEERDAFYASPLYQTWEDRAKTLTEGAPIHRDLHGLEAFFHSSQPPPPRWKMAVATLCGVYPTSLFLGQTVGRFTHGLHPLIGTLIFASAMVALLTWVVMPNVTKLLHHWLHPQLQK